MRPSRAFPCLVVALVLSVSATATTWYVPSDQCPTIQDGLNLAQQGDTVAVAAGEYVISQPIIWPARNGIVLLGAGMDSTVLVGPSLDFVLYVGAAVPIDSTTVIRGLQLRESNQYGLVLVGPSLLIDSCTFQGNGLAGLLITRGSEATIRACRIDQNLRTGIIIRDCGLGLLILENEISRHVGSENGSGIFCDSASPRIVGNDIWGNQTNEGGGGIHCANGSSATILQNDIHDNVAGGRGGGILCDASSPAIIGNTIRTNTGDAVTCINVSAPLISGNSISLNTGFDRHGIFCQDNSDATISENSITNNLGRAIVCRWSSPYINRNQIIANQDGGVKCEHASPLIERNTFLSNSTSYGGAAVLCESESAPSIVGNMIVENVASYGGGGILCSSSMPLISGNSLVRNRSQGHGGAVASYNNAAPEMSFNAFVENSAAGVGDAIYVEDVAPTITRCNFSWNGWGVSSNGWLAVPRAQDNWWGDPSGPWHDWANPEGKGDSLSTYCWDFNPWLEEPDITTPPIPPTDLFAFVCSGDSVYSFAWDAVPIADIGGYRLYFDSDEPGYPYDQVVDVGNATEFRLSGLEPGIIYYVAVTCYDQTLDESWYSHEIEVVPPASGSPPGPADEQMLVHLEPLFPNPFQSRTSVTYVLPIPAEVRVTVHDVLGRQVATIVEGMSGTGRYQYEWLGNDNGGRALAAGVYVVRLVTDGGISQSRKAILAR